MGVLDPDTLRAEPRDALVGVRPGQTTAIIRIPSGYAILKVVDSGAASAAKDADAARNQALAATGAIQSAPDVGGQGEAEGALIQFPKPGNWNQDPRLICEIRKRHRTGRKG